MVDIGHCYITKFGSIHKTEKEAEEAEITEEKTNFANTIAKAIRPDAPWGHWFELGVDIFDNRKEIKKVLDEYEFIVKKE